ncbi:acyl carrier protein [Pseudomonas hunanensis]|uniref:Acyl carrier protein n=1 Tax=Pseudomonas hunanensis TaxID=1247546 RepID=A0ACC6JXV1_9PSED|nr:acyl carrier protein [Pseudomonas hunanensis]MBP2262496.1 acyl carrier protein [Pseudomonas sp. BP8]MDR6711027.1 acyl carrier protein [Pseudomonas hunanensis]HDS1733691.1 acyl carrier protein [Pseudomonas putida]
MNTLSIEQRIRHTLEQLLGPDVNSIDRQASFRDFIGERFDSLMAVEVITAIEDCFAIEVDYLSDDVRFWFETLDKMERFVAQKVEDQLTLQARA